MKKNIPNSHRILVFNHEYPPVGGGGGKITQNLSRELVHQGYQITIFTTHFRHLPLHQKDDEIEIYRIKASRKQIYRASFLDMLFFVIGSCLKGYQFIKRWKPDLIHAHFAVPSGAAAYILSRLTGVPYILTIHGGDVPGAAPEKTGSWFKFVYPFSKVIWKKAQKVIAVSDYVKELAQKRYTASIDVIGNGINLDSISPEKLSVRKEPRILFAGRFSPEKNPLAVVHALSDLRMLPWECVMLGDGLLMQELRTLIKKKNLQDRIHALGWLSQSDVLEWMTKSDILFMPSLMEGLPLTGLQALTNGLALVMSRVGGCVQLIRNGENGYLVDPGDIKGYSNVISTLINEPERLMNCRKTSLQFASQFSIAVVADQYIQIFHQIKEKKKK